MRDKAFTAEIISVGTELLLGDIVNTDAAYAARGLSEHGIFVYHQSVVGDNRGRLLRAIGDAFSRSDAVILTGGLGPTCDDITKEVAAEFFGRRLVNDGDALQNIIERFRIFGRPITENNYKQALVPEGSQVFPNEWGTAPGMAIEDLEHGRVALLLPGPPSEFEPMFTKYALPYLDRFSGSVIRSVNLHLRGIGESAAESILADIMNSSENPTVAPYAGEHEVRIRISARAESVAEADRMIGEMREVIARSEAGKYIYTETDGPYDAKHAAVLELIKRLRAKGYSIAAAESCTGGLLSSLITDIAGVSDIFLGSVVSYANEVKAGVLGVKEDSLAEFGAVSEAVAAEMAEGAVRTLGADCAVSVTGIAGPGGGSEEKPVGTVCFGVCTPRGVKTKTKHFNPRADREKIRRLSAAEAIFFLLDEL